jgi:hypothetical protein
MRSRRSVPLSVLMMMVWVGTLQAGETITAVATVKTAGGTIATTPVSVTIVRTTDQREADTLIAAFKAGGVDGLRKALKEAPPTGSIQLGGGAAVPTHLTHERATDKGRLLTILTETPLFFIGAGRPGAKPTAGYDFGVLDLEIAGDGRGSGTLAPAARITVKDGAFVVEDYGSELVRLTSIATKR